MSDLDQLVYDQLRKQQCGCYCGHCAHSAGCHEVRKDFVAIARKAQVEALREASWAMLTNSISTIAAKWLGDRADELEAKP
jgi:hypothetical protein